MNGFINGFDWKNVEAMKYWSFGAGVSDDTKKTTVKNAIFGEEYMGALKVDGYYQRVLKDEDGNILMIARNRNVKGEIVDKHEWLPQLNEWFESLPNGTCFLCECYWPNNEGSKNITSILGCLKDKAIARQKDAPLHLYVFDVMAYDGVNYNKTPYEERAQILTDISKMEKHKSPFIDYTEFFDGEKLWEQLQLYLASGREGMVIMRKDAIVYNKRTPARVSIKVKKELESSIDCFFTGKAMTPTRLYAGKEIEGWQYWENDVTKEKINGLMYKEYCNGAAIVPVSKAYFNGWAGSLQIGVVGENGEVVPLGWLSNLTDEIKANPIAYINKPMEVTAMELDYSAGDIPSLRHGRFKQWRPDLSLSDCTLAKII